MNSLVQHQKTDDDQDGGHQGGVLSLHPVLEPRQRFVEAVARHRVGENRNRHRRRGDRDVPGHGDPRVGEPRPAVPIAKPAAAQMNSTFGLTTVSAAAAARRATGVSLLRLCIQPGVCADRLRVSQR